MFEVSCTPTSPIGESGGMWPEPMMPYQKRETAASTRWLLDNGEVQVACVRLTGPSWYPGPASGAIVSAPNGAPIQSSPRTRHPSALVVSVDPRQRYCG